MVSIKRFDVFLISLDPTQGSELKKTRPCLVISPNEMNDFIRTVIIAPLTSTSKLYPTRIPVLFDKKQGYVVLDQIRTVDKSRLIKKMGNIDEEYKKDILDILQEMFSE